MNTNTPTIVLFGRTGAGKSALGNKIFGKKFFTEGDTLTSETIDTLAITDYTLLDPQRKVTLIDTPGFADNRKGLDFSNILNNILSFLTTLKGGFNVALYLLPSSKARFDRHDQDELTLLGRLLGHECFKHTFIVLTQVDELSSKKKQEVAKRAREELPVMIKEQCELDFDSSKILLSDFEDFDPFVEKLNGIVRQCPSYMPKIAEGLDVEDPQSIKRFLASKEMKELESYYESKLAEHKKELEAVRESYKSLENKTESQKRQLEKNERKIAEITAEAETWKNQKQELENKLQSEIQKVRSEKEDTIKTLKDEIENLKKVQNPNEELVDKIKSLEQKLSQRNEAPLRMAAPVFILLRPLPFLGRPGPF